MQENKHHCLIHQGQGLHFTGLAIPKASGGGQSIHQVFNVIFLGGEGLKKLTAMIETDLSLLSAIAHGWQQ